MLKVWVNNINMKKQISSHDKGNEAERKCVGREHWCMDDHGFIGKCGIKTKAKLALHLKLVSEK